MSIKPLPKTKAPVGDAHDPDSLYNHMRRFLMHLCCDPHNPGVLCPRLLIAA